MYENRRVDLGYTLRNLKNLLAVFPQDADNKLPMFPDSNEVELRKKIYSALVKFPQLKNSIHDTAYKYAKSLNNQSGIKTKYHYAGDPNGVKKEEIYRILIDIKRKYYDAIRHTENLISYCGQSTKEIERLDSLSLSAIRAFDKIFSDLTQRWETGAYGKTLHLANMGNMIPKRGAMRTAYSTFRSFRRDLNDDIAERTFEKWCKGENPPRGFPKNWQTPTEIEKFAKSYDKIERKKSKKTHYKEDWEEHNE